MAENNKNKTNKQDDLIPPKYNFIRDFMTEEEYKNIRSKQSLDYRKNPDKFLIVLGSILTLVGIILLIVFSIVFIFSNIEFSCRPQPCTPLTGVPLYLTIFTFPGIDTLIGIVCLSIGFYKRKHKKD